jgi:hypothetical protein
VTEGTFHLDEIDCIALGVFAEEGSSQHPYRRWGIQTGKRLSTKELLSSVMVCQFECPTGVNYDMGQPQASRVPNVNKYLKRYLIMPDGASHAALLSGYCCKQNAKQLVFPSWLRRRSGLLSRRCRRP